MTDGSFPNVNIIYLPPKKQLTPLESESKPS